VINLLLMAKKRNRTKRSKADSQVVPRDTAARLISLVGQPLTIHALSAEDLRAVAERAGHLSCPNAINLGPFTGMTDGEAALYFVPPDKLFLVVFSETGLDDSLVRRVGRCCRWIESHPKDIWDSVRDKTQLGPMPLNRAALFVKIVAPGFADRIQERISSLGVPTVVFELAVGTLGSEERLLQRVHESTSSGSTSWRANAPPPTDVRVTRNDVYAIRPLLSALRSAVGSSGASASRRRDSLSAEAFVRIYGLLVVLAARMTINGTPSPDDGVESNRKGPNRLAGICLDLLGRLLRIATSQKAAFDRGGALLQIPASLLNDLRCCGETADEFSAAELSPNWQTPVPVTFGSLINEMGFPEFSWHQGVSGLDRRPSRAFQLPIGTVEAIGGTIAITQCCDILAGTIVGRRAEMNPVTADLVRVVCGHRLLVELVGLSDRRIAYAILGDTAAMAAILSGLGGEPGRSDDLAASVAIVRQSCRSSIMNIQSSGLVSRQGKRKSESLETVISQERALVRFFRKVL